MKQKVGKANERRGEGKYLAVLWLSVAAFFFSILVYLQHQGNLAVNGVCHAVGFFSQCSIVGSSSYAKMFGIDNSIIGMVGFAAMIMLALLQFQRPNHANRLLIIAGSLIAGILAFIFVYLQMFVIQAYCIYCLVVDAASIALLAIAVVDARKAIWF